MITVNYGNGRLLYIYPSGQPNSPFVVIIPGGKWQNDNSFDNPMLIDIEPLRAAGFSCVVVSYSLAPAYPWPTQLYDCLDAINYLITNADTYQLDSGRIGLYGSSAGGQLALLIGNATGLPTCTIAAPTRLNDPFTRLPLQQEISEILTPVFEQTSHNNHVMWMASPTQNANGSGRYYLIHGLKDEQIPPVQAELMYQRLTTAGASVSLLMVENAGHILQPIGGETNPSRQDITANVGAFFWQWV